MPKRIPAAVLTALLTLLAVIPTAGAAGPVSLHASAGVSVHGWDSGLGNNPVRVETEPLQALRLDGALGWRGRRLLKLEYARTLTDSPEQQEMLEASGTQSANLTETLGYLDLLAVIVGSERYRAGELNYLERLLGLKFEYSQNLYHAGTASTTDFAYVGFGDPDQVKSFKDGEQLGFKTTFRDLRVTAPVWFDPIYVGAVLRMGYFQSRWEKVAGVPGGTYGGDPLLQDTRLDTGGLTVDFDSRLEQPGIGWAVGFDLGFLGSGLSGPVRLTHPEDEEARFQYGAARCEFRWNLEEGGSRGGLAATFGASFEYRDWEYNGTDVDRDILTRIFGRVGFDLAL